MLSLPEVAGFLRLHTNTIRAWVRKGKLKPVKMGKEKVDMFHKSEVEKFKATLEQKGMVVKEVHQAFPVVGIGASAGGLEAMGLLLSKLPTDLGLSYIFVSHMEENGEHTFVEILQRKTAIPVRVAENGMQLRPDQLYVGPAGMQVAVVNNTITLQRSPKAPLSAFRPIDSLFRALANEYQNNAIGIVLSGGGMDGTQGLRAIKAEDGLTIVQDVSAQDPSMPQNAQEAGVVDVVLAPGSIGPELADLVKRLFPTGDTRLPAKHENELGRVLQLLLEERGVDFKEYKESTIHRRIIRRMVLSKCDKLSDYLKLLRDVPSELDTLFSELLISVTSFFRDPTFHKALTERVFPELFKNRAGNDTLRIWVSACAGGEEVVSIAITLLEFLRANAINTAVQIFATDLNERTIEKARLGIYRKSALQDVDPERLRQFFQHVDGHYQVIKSIRDMCVFAKHDLLKDPPFSRVDLISCQNVLIYLENHAQGRVLKNFHYALKPDGILALGKSETTANAPDLFLQPEREYKVYVKKFSDTQRLQLDVRYKPSKVQELQPISMNSNQGRGLSGSDLDKDVEQLLLNTYVPACVLVDRDLEIRRFIGPTAEFIRPRSGRASLNLLKMVRDDLAFELRALIQRARKEKVPTRKNGVPIKLDNGLHEVSVEVVPLGGARDPHFLVLFRKEEASIPVRENEHPDPTRSSDTRDRRIAILEKELADAREQVRSISEESELGTQELQAANEEVVSSNEELQSINEELETSKEELQSINEEYATINEELQVRNDALLESEERYRQLIRLMPVAVFTCDRDGRIDLYNEKATELWGRVPERREGEWHGAHKLYDLDGEPVANQDAPMGRSVREGIAIRNEELIVERPDGTRRSVLINPTPLHDGKGRSLGAISVLLDITERQQEEAERQQLTGMLERSLNEIYIFDLESLKFDYVNQGALNNLGYTLPQMRGMTPVDIKPELDSRQFETLVEKLRSGEKDKILFKTVHRRANGSDYPVEVHLQIVSKGPKRMFMAMILDITDRKLDEERLRVVIETGKLGVWDWDLLADHISWTEPVFGIHGVTKDSFTPTMSGYHELIHPDDRQNVSDSIKAALEENVPYEIEFRTVNGEGKVNWVFTNAVILRDKGRPIRMMGATMNITQRKEAEEAADRLAAIVESSEDAIIGLDLHGTVTDWNTGAESLFGYQEDEVIGKSIQILLPADRAGEETEFLERIAKGERVAHFETKRLRKDGAFVDVTLSLSPIKDEQGIIVGAAKIARDITSSKRAEENLRASEQRFHLLADNVSQLIWMAEADGSAMWFNKRWHEFSGMTSEEIQLNSRSLHHPDHFDRATNSLKERAAEGEAWNDMFPLKGVDGQYHWFLANAMPVRDDAGKVVRWFGTCTDVTAQREAQEQVRESEERFRLLADNIGQLAWIAEPNGDIHWYNKRWFDQTGTTIEEMQGWGWQRVLHPDHMDRVTAKFKEHLAAGKDWEDLFAIKCADGEYRWFLSRAFPVRNSEGVIERWFGTNTDISDRKNMEDELASIATNKDNFLATLAHELRGPLAPLKNGLQLLEMTTDDPSVQENTRSMMVRQLDHMVRLVDDLMDLSRINTGKITLTFDEVDLSDVVATAMETSRPLIDQNGHSLTVELGNEKFMVLGDRDRLVQVVANLLTNAAKYTPQGGMIDVVVERNPSDISISVKDSGIGIEADKLDMVFDMFAQVDPDQKNRSGGGLGIGLNIVKRLMEKHHGSVEVSSEGLGKGSKFTIRIPRTPGPVAKASTPQTTTAEKLLKRRVLVVDDNEDAALSMSMILKKRGHEIAVAHDGENAVEKGTAFKPEIVIMDIGMPKMNGYEACAAMRKTEWGKNCMIVALSGWGQDEDRQKSKVAGFDRHVVKPIDRATLEWIVVQEKE